MRLTLRLLVDCVKPIANPYRFVASDLDGTLLSANHTLSDYTRRTLRLLLLERGTPLILATGRLHADVAKIHRNLCDYVYGDALGGAAAAVGSARGATAAAAAASANQRGRGSSLSSSSSSSSSSAQGGPKVNTPLPPIYLITSNGAIAHNAATDEILLEQNIPAPIVRELYALLPASENRINTNLCQRDHWFTRMGWEEMLAFHVESGLQFEVLERVPPAPPVPSSSSHSANGQKEGEAQLTAREGCLDHVEKFFFSSWEKPLLEHLERVLLRRYGDVLTINFSAEYCLDITAKGVTKASALAAVMADMPLQSFEAGDTAFVDAHTNNRELCVAQRLKRTIAFGNDLNDMAMVLSVGKGCLPANSNPKLIQLCPHLEVIESHEVDGTARKLRRVFNLPL